MAARMPFGWLMVSLVIAAGWPGPAQGQYLHAGPGVIVQRQIRGPFVYGLRPSPRMTYPFQAPTTLVPAPGPYLQGPVMVPSGRTYLPNPRPPGNITPYGIPVRPYPPRPYSGYRPRSYGGYRSQPYRGYQPRPNRPRFADPYAPPQGLYSPRTGEQADTPRDIEDPNAVQKSTGAAHDEADGHVMTPDEASPRPNVTVTEPNRPAEP